jgi:hypothetical protein
VGWDGQDDPLHPRNYPEGRKWVLLGIVSGITFLSPLSSSIVAPGISIMNQELGNTSSILSTLTVSIFILGFAVCSCLYISWLLLDLHTRADMYVDISLEETNEHRLDPSSWPPSPKSTAAT